METARIHVRVTDLERSTEFYRTYVGWRDEVVGTGFRLMRNQKDRFILLSMGDSPEAAPYLHPQHQAPKPGDRVYQIGSDLDAVAAQLPSATWEENATSRTLLLPDPDGYIVAYWEEKPLSDEEILILYREGPDALEQALAGLTGADLDLVRAPGKWSIRQTVRHILDSDLSTMNLVKFALAESGRTYQGNPWTPDTWAAGLEYHHGPIDADVRLFRAQREHVLALCERLPGALDRHVVQSGRTWTVRHLIKLVAGHALGHFEQIWETRQRHGHLSAIRRQPEA